MERLDLRRPHRHPRAILAAPQTCRVHQAGAAALVAIGPLLLRVPLHGQAMEDLAFLANETARGAL